MPKKSWKKIWENSKYVVSNYGDIGIIKNDNSLRLMQQRMDEKGYYKLNLIYMKRKYTVRVHRIVAQTFIGYMPDGYEVNHKDGDKTNNFYKNLEITTSSGNMKHAYKIGLMDRKGSKNPRSQLIESDILLIRDLYEDNYFTYNVLSDIFNVSYNTIAKIITRRTWNHI